MSVIVGPPPKRNRAKFPFVGTIDFQGIPVLVENRKGSVRRGTDKDGHAWATKMHAHYGELPKTEGVDGDKVDVYVGPDVDSKIVVVVHQNDPVTHEYDEDKCLIGFSTVSDALALYRKQYDRPGFYGSHTTMTLDEFKKKIADKANRGVMLKSLFQQGLFKAMAESDTQKSVPVTPAEVAASLTPAEVMESLIARVQRCLRWRIEVPMTSKDGIAPPVSQAPDPAAIAHEMATDFIEQRANDPFLLRALRQLGSRADLELLIAEEAASALEAREHPEEYARTDEEIPIAVKDFPLVKSLSKTYGGDWIPCGPVASALLKSVGHRGVRELAVHNQRRYFRKAMGQSKTETVKEHKLTAAELMESLLARVQQVVRWKVATYGGLGTDSTPSAIEKPNFPQIAHEVAADLLAQRLNDSGLTSALRLLGSRSDLELLIAEEAVSEHQRFLRPKDFIEVDGDAGPRFIEVKDFALTKSLSKAFGGDWSPIGPVGFALLKAASHKYIKRVPKPGGGWRYYYKVTAGIGNEKHIVQGARFAGKHEGKEGHFEITEDHGDGTVTVKHSGSGVERRLKKQDILDAVKGSHKEALDAHEAGKKSRAIERAKKDLEGAKAAGSQKHIDRHTETLKKLGALPTEEPAKEAPKTATEAPKAATEQPRKKAPMPASTKAAEPAPKPASKPAEPAPKPAEAPKPAAEPAPKPAEAPKPAAEPAAEPKKLPHIGDDKLQEIATHNKGRTLVDTRDHAARVVGQHMKDHFLGPVADEAHKKVMDSMKAAGHSDQAAKYVADTIRAGYMKGKRDFDSAPVYSIPDSAYHSDGNDEKVKDYTSQNEWADDYLPAKYHEHAKKFLDHMDAAAIEHGNAAHGMIREAKEKWEAQHPPTGLPEPSTAALNDPEIKEVAQRIAEDGQSRFNNHTESEMRDVAREHTKGRATQNFHANFDTHTKEVAEATTKKMKDAGLSGADEAVQSVLKTYKNNVRYNGGRPITELSHEQLMQGSGLSPQGIKATEELGNHIRNKLKEAHKQSEADAEAIMHHIKTANTSALAKAAQTSNESPQASVRQKTVGATALKPPAALEEIRSAGTAKGANEAAVKTHKAAEAMLAAGANRDPNTVRKHLNYASQYASPAQQRALKEVADHAIAVAKATPKPAKSVEKSVRIRLSPLVFTRNRRTH